MNGVNQFGSRTALQQIAGGPCLEGLFGIGDISMHGEKDDFRANQSLELPAGFKAMQQRHLHITHDDIRIQLLRRSHQGTTVFHFPHNIEFLLQDLRHPIKDQGVIIR